MPIEFQCPGCGATLRVNDEAKGRQAQCPKCGKIAQLPDQLSSTLPVVLSGQAAPGQADENIPPLELIPSRIDLGSVISQGWAACKTQYGLGLVVFLLIFVIEFIVGAVSGLLGPVAGNVTSLFVGAWLTAGVILFFLKVLRGQDPKVEDLFAGGQYLLRLVGAKLLLFFFLLLIVLVGCVVPAAIGYYATAAPQDQQHDEQKLAQKKQIQDNHDHGQDNQAKEIKAPGNGVLNVFFEQLQGDPAGQVAAMIFAVAFLICLVPITILGLMISQYAYLIVDRNMGIWEAFTCSAQITRGNKGSLFLLALYMMVLTIGGLLVCCIGLFFVLPLVSCLYAATYLAMIGQVAGSSSQPNLP